MAHSERALPLPARSDDDPDAETASISSKSKAKIGYLANVLHAETAYRIEHPTIKMVLSDMWIPSRDPGPGDHVAPFSVGTTDGKTIDDQDLRSDGRPTLLVFGSITCPVTESAGDGLRDLHARYGERVRFVLVNVREAHPGASVPQPHTFEQKAEHARRLKDRHRLPFEVAVDDIDGTLHRQFGPRPSSAYVIDPTGEILFRAHWSNVTSAIEEAVAAAADGRRPPHADAGHTLRAMTAMTGHASAAFSTAGRGATLDTWKAAPPFGAMIAVSRVFGFLRPSRRGLPAMGVMSAIVIGLVAVLALTV